MKALILRLDAPMMSFGTVLVDQHGFIDRFPGVSMLCGLIANALGWHHKEFDLLQTLQSRISYAARWDVHPERTVDYHTVDLGQPKMREEGWTTQGEPEHRAGGPDARFGTHQRYRHYWADGLMTVALSLTGEGTPSLDDVVHALRYPARPLFLGRKTCLPSRPLLDPQSPIVEGDDLLSILIKIPIWERGDSRDDFEACWPAELESSQRAHIRRVYDLRDWHNQLPTGSRLRAEGLIGKGHT